MFFGWVINDLVFYHILLLCVGCHSDATGDPCTGFEILRYTMLKYWNGRTLPLRQIFSQIGQNLKSGFIGTFGTTNDPDLKVPSGI